MASNFKQCRAENCTSAYGPFLQLSHFAVSVTFRAKSGGRERTITVGWHEAEFEIAPAGDLVEEERERVWVKCLRDESAEKGGIARPEIGDRLWRETDEPDAPWGFAGSVRRETPHAWELLFERNRPRRFGASR